MVEQLAMDVARAVHIYVAVEHMPYFNLLNRKDK